MPRRAGRTNSYSGHSEFRHVHTVVPEHPLQAVQVCPVSRDAFLEIISIGGDTGIPFRLARSVAQHGTNPDDAGISFQTRCIPPLAIRLRHPTGSSNPCVVLDRSAGEWLALPEVQRPGGKEAALRVGLVQMAEFGTYPLGQQFRYRRGNASFSTMTAAITAAIKTWGAHTEPPKHRIETAAPIILQVAPTMTAWTRPHSFAVPLQLFADHNLWQPSENWLGVRELLTQPHTQVHPRDLRSVTCWAFASHRVGRHFTLHRHEQKGDESLDLFRRLNL